MRTSTVWLPRLLLGGVGVAALLLLTAPSVPAWGQRHSFDASKGAIRLNPGQTVEQTFTWEYPALDVILLWIDPGSRHNQGQLTLRVTAEPEERQVTVALASIPDSGTVVFPLPRPLRAPLNKTGQLRLQLHGTTQPVHLRYQVDGSKYRDGELQQRAGDLGFQLRYQRSALGSTTRHALAAAGLLLTGAVVSWVLRVVVQQGLPDGRRLRREAAIAVGLGLAVAIFYGVFLLRPGEWLGPGDFVKDVAYLKASADALRQGTWPVWSHLTCGGLPLLANPESSSLSLGTVLGLILPPDRALFLLVALEAGIGAAGTYLLGRSLSLTRLGSSLAAVTALLSAAYPYRLLEGFSMTGAAVAFSPWVLLGFTQAVAKKRWWGVLLAGSSLALIFLRGEVHIIVGLILLLIFWTVLQVVAQRSVYPLLALAAVGAVSLLGASPKLLAYAEHPDLFTSNLKPYVVHLGQAGLFDDVFFTPRHRDFLVPVRYGTDERWGNFGAYTGTLPWIAAGIGILATRRRYWWLLAGALFLLVISEGTAFDHLLRPLGPIGVLLRLPTRVLSIYVVLLGLLAGQGLSWLQKHLFVWGTVTAAALLTATTLDLGLHSGQLLQHSFKQRLAGSGEVVRAPLLAAHQYEAASPELHPAVLLRQNYLLPQLCADLNIDHPFTAQAPRPYALASAGVQAPPNRLVFPSLPPRADVHINENFTSAWVADQGVVLESSTKALHLITPDALVGSVQLHVKSGTARTQQMLLTTLLLTLVLGIGTRRRDLARRWQTSPGGQKDRETHRSR